MKKTNVLPHISWLPKLYKNLTKAQFQIAAPKCFLKQLSKSITITAVLKIRFYLIKSYNNWWRYYSGINTFRIIVNSQAVTKGIDDKGRRTTAVSISFFNFYTLYTIFITISSYSRCCVNSLIFLKQIKEIL